MKKNVVLIGMPGAGKSTIGVLLAKRLGYDFVDTDVLIQISQGEILQETLNSQGYLALRAIEEQVLLALDVTHTVVATGGSAVYSDKAMSWLGGNGVVVHLSTPLNELIRRIHDFEARGIARRPDQGFAALFTERTKLYRIYAQITQNATPPPEEVVTALQKALRKVALRE